ncbi:alpha/beta hydrolase [Nocardia brasiliensis]|uniref:Putative lipase/esterase n=1 Tax=Nocardia brasiliensis (strain ATCC 700358 / HUJEG-1) TaxID=1133849 RepID=K0EHW8_NOCB7|nr:alpha/beta hydrolase [Nocardia brasiliensis]AFT98877.1 putative lipase/esterase [Nocardia brasiliensis ATCC 700358]OCF87288.1 lipase [Nocardia brasiliensis]
MINGDPLSLPSRGTIWALQSTLRPLGARLPANRLGVAGARLGLALACQLWFDRMLPTTSVDVTTPRGRTAGEWVGVPPRPGRALIYYLHGSGYVGCSPATHRGLVSELARRLDRPAFTLRYRRAPEHRFPAAHDDVLNGYRWLLDQGHAAEDIVLMGDSAGGHMALGLCGQLRELGLPQPKALIGFSALVDATWSLARARRAEVDDAFMTLGLARRMTGLYYGTTHFEDPRMDVAAHVGPDLPPMLLQAGGSEMLSADAEHYGTAQRAAGGHCEVQLWPGMFHVFQVGHRFLPEARAALDAVEKFVAEVENPQVTRGPRTA